MHPRELISQLEERGVVLSVKGETLRFNAPKHVMTVELRQMLSANKAAIIELLRSRESANDQPTPCPVCGDPERWPTTRGPVCPTCWLAKSAPAPGG